MSVFVPCSAPRKLVTDIYSLILQNKIRTWEVDADGDLTHSPPQYRNKAWMRPHPEANRLVFRLFGQNGVLMKKYLYGIYHGRLIEELLNHFDEVIGDPVITAMGSDYDSFRVSLPRTALQGLSSMRNR
jgi:hypothetical protein